MIDKNLAAKTCRERALLAEQTAMHYEGILPVTAESLANFELQARTARIWHGRSTAFDARPDGSLINEAEVDSPFTEDEILSDRGRL